MLLIIRLDILELSTASTCTVYIRLYTVCMEVKVKQHTNSLRVHQLQIKDRRFITLKNGKVVPSWSLMVQEASKI